MPATSMTGCVFVVSARASLGPSLMRRATSSPKASEASRKVSATAGWSPQASSMPTDCDPCPGKTKAKGCMACLLFGCAKPPRASEVQQDRAPGETAAHAFEHEGVALLDLAAADRGVERQRDRGGRRVAVLVHGDDELVHGHLQAPGRALHDA